MISSHDGTEDRLPRAALRLWRAACSLAGSADPEGAEGASLAGGGGEATGAEGLAAARVAAAEESAALEDAVAAVC